jgi:hypothetical protein
MLLNLFTRHNAQPTQIHHAASRMASTVTGTSGRVYTRSQVLKHHPKDPALSIFKAK